MLTKIEHKAGEWVASVKRGAKTETVKADSLESARAAAEDLLAADGSPCPDGCRWVGSVPGVRLDRAVHLMRGPKHAVSVGLLGEAPADGEDDTRRPYVWLSGGAARELEMVEAAIARWKAEHGS